MSKQAAATVSTHQSSADARIEEAGDRFLRRFVNFWIIAGLGVMFIDLAIRHSDRNFAGMAGLIGGVLARVAIHGGHMRAARYLIVGFLSVAAVILPLLVHGVRTPVLVAWPLLILLAGWLLGRRAAAILGVIAVVATTAIWQVEEQGLFIWTLAPRAPETWWRTFVVVFALTAVTVWYWVGNYNEVHEHECDLREQLDQANAALSARLSHADTTLTQVRTDYEKAYPMAMMAAVIPSLTHDLNTPVGNTSMAASTLSDHLAQFKKQIEGGSLRRSDLDSFLKTCTEGLRIIETANRRTGELVGSLKQMSIDQVTQQRRSFVVDRLVDEVLTTLAPSLKKRHVAVVQDIDPELDMDSFPGPLGQVITNLVQNALVHGFDNRPSGKICVRAHLLDRARLRIEVDDDGVGMTDEVRLKVFQSFFTTRLGQGGSGIGLTFSKRLIEETLGGTITVESTPDIGSRFIMDLPRVAPTEARVQSITPAATPDMIELSQKMFQGSVFPPHGRYAARSEGQFVLMEATGPFNAEIATQYSQVTMPLLMHANAKGNFAVIIEFHENMLMGPEAISILAEFLRNAVAKGMRTVGTAFVVSAEVEGQAFMPQLLREKIYAPAGVPFDAFASQADARAWLQEKLDAVKV